MSARAVLSLVKRVRRAPRAARARRPPRARLLPRGLGRAPSSPPPAFSSSPPSLFFSRSLNAPRRDDDAQAPTGLRPPARRTAVMFDKPNDIAAKRAALDRTPHIVGALGLAAAIDYVSGIGLDRIHAHEAALVRQAREALSRINSVRLYGPEDSAGIVSFTIAGVHPHDIGTILDESRVAIRAGHHCAQPLMEVLGVDATARASFGVYNSAADVDALAEGMERVTRIFG